MLTCYFRLFLFILQIQILLGLWFRKNAFLTPGSRPLRFCLFVVRDARLGPAVQVRLVCRCRLSQQDERRVEHAQHLRHRPQPRCQQLGVGSWTPRVHLQPLQLPAPASSLPARQDVLLLQRRHRQRDVGRPRCAKRYGEMPTEVAYEMFLEKAFFNCVPCVCRERESWQWLPFYHALSQTSY